MCCGPRSERNLAAVTTMSNKNENKNVEGAQYEDIPSPVESLGSDVSEVVLSDRSTDSDGLDSTIKSMLDFSSPSFSPVLALACSSNDVLPSPGSDVKVYLNLQQFSKAVYSPSKSPRKDVASIKDLATKTKTKESSSKVTAVKEPTSTDSNPQFPIPGRRFLLSQMPVYRPRKEHPNVLTLMDTVEGPLSVLRRVMTDNVRVKLWTRTEKGFRGFLTGFVEGFDKHWNILLRDVDEQFVRKKVIKFPIFDGSDPLKNPEDEIADDNEKQTEIASAFSRLLNYARQNDGARLTSTSSNWKAKRPKTININQKSRPVSQSFEGVTKSKTVFIGDMDPLEICRTGLAKLSLLDDVPPNVNVSSTTKQNMSKTLMKKKSLTVFKTPFKDSFGFFVVAQTKKFELVERHVGQLLLMGNDIVFIETSGC